MQVRGFPVYSQNTLRTFNISTPPLDWRFPKYVELRTSGHVTAFHLSSLYFCFKFQIFVYFQGIYFESGCVYVFVMFLSEDV